VDGSKPWASVSETVPRSAKERRMIPIGGVIVSGPFA
jgi:hypothetical protein